MLEVGGNRIIEEDNDAIIKDIEAIIEDFHLHITIRTLIQLQQGYTNYMQEIKNAKLHCIAIHDGNLVNRC